MIESGLAIHSPGRTMDCLMEVTGAHRIALVCLIICRWHRTQERTMFSSEYNGRLRPGAEVTGDDIFSVSELDGPSSDSERSGNMTLAVVYARVVVSG